MYKYTCSSDRAAIPFVPAAFLRGRGQIDGGTCGASPHAGPNQKGHQMLNPDQLETAWVELDESDRIDVLAAVRLCYKNLEEGRRCKSVCPMNELPYSTRKKISGTLLRFKGCELCAVFPELRSETNQVRELYTNTRCPCYHFGREDTIRRLQELLK